MEERSCTPLLWRKRFDGQSLLRPPHRVFDAIIFSNEVDILELCWLELHPYVTKFVIIEGETTFTGIPKPLYFALNWDRFAFAKNKIVHGVYPGWVASNMVQEDPFNL
ncbi:hypothetical protein LguiA_030372 [Lonicera macranthoides]